MNRPKPVLSFRNQIVVGILLFAGMAGILGYVFQMYWEHGRVIDLDDATRFQNKFVVDLNQAESAEIASLPGVGPKLAQAIVEFRQARGPFHRLEDITRVPGIGPKKLEGFQQHLAPLSGGDSKQTSPQSP